MTHQFVRAHCRHLPLFTWVYLGRGFGYDES